MFGKLHAQRIALALLVMGGTIPAAAVAQESGPLLKSDLVRMMTASNLTATEMAATVRMHCIGFEPTQRDRSQLERLPNADVVMVEVDRCAARPAAAPPPRRVRRTPPRPRNQIQLDEFEVASPFTTVALNEEPATRKTVMPAEYSSFTKTKPQLQNWDEVSKAFLREYRPNVRTPGTVILSLTVSSDGRVLHAEVKAEESTSDRAMWEAALSVTSIMRFKPAMVGNEAAGSLTELPFNFAAN
jgi:TonB family protein